MSFLQKAVWVTWVLFLIVAWGTLGHADMDREIKIGLGLWLSLATFFSQAIVEAITGWLEDRLP